MIMVLKSSEKYVSMLFGRIISKFEDNQVKKENKEVKKTKKSREEIDSSVNESAAAVSETPENDSDKTLNNDGRIGTMLRETRLKRGEELEDIARILRIRKIYLEAIENSNYAEIPEAPYGQGFVRSYAEYLGLNAVRMSQLFKEETEAGRQNDTMYVLEPQAEADIPGRKYILVSLLALALIYAAWLFYTSAGNDDTSVEAPVSEAAEEVSSSSDDYPLKIEDFNNVSASGSESDSSETENKAETDVPSAEPEALPVIEIDSSAQTNSPQVHVSEGSFEEASVPSPAQSEAVPADKVAEPSQPAETPAADNNAEPQPSPTEIDTDAKVLIKVKKEAWIEAKNADKLYISKVVDKGFTYRVPDEPGMIISIGRYDAADVYVNGKLTPVFTAGKKTGIKVDSLLEAANH